MDATNMAPWTPLFSHENSHVEGISKVKKQNSKILKLLKNVTTFVYSGLNMLNTSRCISFVIGDPHEHEA